MIIKPPWVRLKEEKYNKKLFTYDKYMFTDQYGIRHEICAENIDGIWFIVGKVYRYPHEEEAFNTRFYKSENQSDTMDQSVVAQIDRIKHELEKDAEWIANRYGLNTSKASD